MHEIITLQFGHYANFTGTHFWNTQERYFSCCDSELNDRVVNPDVLFRTGLNPQGQETYTPRLLAFDLKGGYGSLSKYNDLYSVGQEANSQQAWNDKVERYDQPAYLKNDYLQSLDKEEDHSDNIVSHSSHNLDKSVHVWSDYNRLYYHPKTMNDVPGFYHGDDNTPFDIYSAGRDAYFRNDWNEHMMEENFRFFAEECDQLQGFQILTNVTDGFGGFVSSFLDDVRDDYGKTPIVTYGFTDVPKGRFSSEIPRSILNVGFATQKITELSSIYVPLILPSETDVLQTNRTRFLKLQLSLPYYSSAILAAAIETSTLPMRMQQNSMVMGDFVHHLNWRQNTKVTSLSTVFPLPITDTAGLEKLHPLMISHDVSEANSFIWNLSTREQPSVRDINFAQIFITRGLPEATDFIPTQDELRYHDRPMPELGQTPLEALGLYLAKYRSMRTHSLSIPLKFPISDPFPEMFSSSVQDNGLINEFRHRTKPNPSAIPHLVQLSTSSVMSRYFNDISTLLKHVNFKTHEYVYDREGIKGGVGMDDYRELVNWCETTMDNYDASGDKLW